MTKKRLYPKYTVDTKNGKMLTKPERQAMFLAIDEFLLHKGHQYVTIIIDLETGYIIWIAHGKKKQIVYDFIEHVGENWLTNVKAVACDMNSDFQEAIEEKCKHIKIVFDHFHIIKNFNDKVISEIRKDEQLRLKKIGNESAAKSRFLLTSNRSTLQHKDKLAKKADKIRDGNELFNTLGISFKEGNEERYNKLISENPLLFTIDMIKEKLANAYELNDELIMKECIDEIIDICNSSENDHLKWFSKLLSRDLDGIISHATFKISLAK